VVAVSRTLKDATPAAKWTALFVMVVGLTAVILVITAIWLDPTNSTPDRLYGTAAALTLGLGGTCALTGMVIYG
jgi:hypothetical protein